MPSQTVRRARVAVAAVLSGVALSACGATSGSTAASPQSDPMSGMSMSPSSSMGAETTGMTSMIMIQDFSFSGPAPVRAGSTVTVMNEDKETHTVTADDGDSFDVTVPAGATRTFTAPAKPGSYPFHCSFHSDMHGALRVR
ncbi:cupredoxin domain-containing protein [Nocardioides sp.]|uniref:cupredoxin domain-containing protein n=1 Tax=Nocardioides sp. TaxID=35761 RepID=UPI002F422B4E